MKIFFIADVVSTIRILSMTMLIQNATVSTTPVHHYSTWELLNLVLVIQYHEKVKGVQGDFSGIRIANETHCQIDRKQNPNGMCRKQVTAHQKNDALASSSVSCKFIS